MHLTPGSFRMRGKEMKLGLIHTPAVAEKRRINNIQTFGIYCQQCTESAGNWVKCKFLANFPNELVAIDIHPDELHGIQGK